ncbi:gluzincin family metallopeptidase [Arenibaculum pallidiluteum]|uniref:hypothetical protein n=1 Tax=Arenibaculum pallidiluteum TaxID=2812559 RepID=UPI001A963C5F|nr:hypothetical protein [Arenibaculum pallidiluteum]
MSAGDLGRTVPSTTQAVAAVAQSRGAGRLPRGGADMGPGPGPPGAGEVLIGPRVLAAFETRPYERARSEAVYRPLRIFALDPSASKLDGAVAVVNVPYEPLAPGPQGAMIRVDPGTPERGGAVRSVRLDDAANLIRQGRDPSTTDPEFHQQMVYAVASVVCAAFRRALGRDIAWAFDGLDPDGRRRLVLRPHGGEFRNAFYDESTGSVVFGYFHDEVEVRGTPVSRGYVFTCLSHDIVAHEVAHALLHGLRARFTVPSGPDVLAFHEAFADLVALFQHFSYRTVVEAGVRDSRGDLRLSDALLSLARQFGEASGRPGALRRALEAPDTGGPFATYHEAGDEPHALGSVLVAAAFDAFLTVYRRKTGRYIRLATQGTGVPVGELSADLLSVLAEEAAQLADQFLAMCIRAIDYCPPVDIEFGEFLRAVVTADRELVPDDPHAYREAWINAFRRRGIYPSGVPTLSEDALLWRGPELKIPPAPDLAFSRLAFDGDPGRAAGPDETRRQARAIGTLIADPFLAGRFGIALPGDPRLGRDAVSPPTVESVRTARRIGPDGQILFDTVAEVTQARTVRGEAGSFEFLGGATLIFGPKGELNYMIGKSVLNERRLARQQRFMADKAGSALWARDGDTVVPRRSLFRICHGSG